MPFHLNTNIGTGASESKLILNEGAKLKIGLDYETELWRSELDITIQNYLEFRVVDSKKPYKSVFN